MAYAGLRPNEVRGLRRRDVRLRWEGEAVAGGFVSVREGRSFGETHTPKPVEAWARCPRGQAVIVLMP